MIEYYFVILFLTLIHFPIFALCKNQKTRKTVLFSFSFLPLFVLWILKKDILGADSLNYLDFFTDVGKETWGQVLTGSDPLFFVQMKIASSFGLSYYVFQSFFYIQNSVLFGLFLWHKTERPDYCILAFVFYLTFGFSFSVYREFEAFCILLFASLFLEERSLKGRLIFLLLWIVALGYHKVAAIGLVFFAFSFIKKQEWPLLTYLIVFLCFFVLAPGVSSFLGLFDFSFVPYRPSNLGFGKSWFETLFYFGLFLISYMLYSPNHGGTTDVFKHPVFATDHKNHFSSWIINPFNCLFLVALANLMSHYYPVFSRFSYLFLYYCLPASLDVFNKSSLLSRPLKFSLFVFLYLSGLACFLYFMLRSNMFKINPYEFFWN